jgi:hypothetical protein
MSYLFIKNLLQREKFVPGIIFIKNKKFQKPQKTKKKSFLVGFLGGFFGFFGWVFLGGFFIANPGSRRW